MELGVDSQSLEGRRRGMCLEVLEVLERPDEADSMVRGFAA
jgi:hypothetical protein